MEHPHQRPVGADLDPLADQVPGHRVQRLGDLDVMVAVDLGGGVDGQVVGQRRRRCEPGRLGEGEQLRRAALRRAVDGVPGPGGAPHLRPALGIGQVQQALPSEKAVAHQRDRALHPRLVCGPPHPRRVHQEAPGLGVLDEGLVEPGLGGVGLLHDGGHVVRDHHGEHAAEKRPRRLEPGDHRGGGLGEGQPHEAVPAVAGSEDQRLAHPAPAQLRVRDQAHPAEVDLTLPAGLAVSDADRGGAGPAAHPENLQGVAVQGALGHDHTLAGQQLTGLDRGQALGDHPRLELLVVGHQRGPHGAMAVGAVRAHTLAHHRQQLVGELLLTAGPVDAGLDRGAHIAAHSLAVHPRQPLDRTQPLAPQPQPQHFSDLVHANLPEHGHLPEPLLG